MKITGQFCFYGNSGRFSFSVSTKWTIVKYKTNLDFSSPVFEKSNVADELEVEYILLKSNSPICQKKFSLFIFSIYLLFIN